MSGCGSGKKRLLLRQGIGEGNAEAVEAGLGRAARQNEAITYAMERLYLSTPPATQEQIRGIVELIVEGGGLLEDVTDGEPHPRPLSGGEGGPAG